MQNRALSVFGFLAILGWLTPQIGYCMNTPEETEKTSTFIKMVPYEKQAQIFEWLPKLSLKKVPAVCKIFRDIVYRYNSSYMNSITAPVWADNVNLENLATIFPKITSLDLAYNHKINCIPPLLITLKELHLGQNDSNLVISHLSNLNSLNLGDLSEGITNNIITRLTGLKTLTVGHSNQFITNDGMRFMTNLTKLTLNCNNYNHIDENSLIYLTNITELNNTTTIKKINSFVRFVNLTNLTKLHLFNRDHINYNEYAVLCNTLPNLKIDWAYNNRNNPTWAGH